MSSLNLQNQQRAQNSAFQVASSRIMAQTTTSVSSQQQQQSAQNQQQQQQQGLNPQQPQQIHLQQQTTTTAIHGTPQHQTAQAQNQMQQQLQLIQQPLQANQYLQQLYNSQGQMQILSNGNLALHHPGINPQIQPAHLTPSIQVIAAGKTFQPNQLGAHQMLTAATSYTAIPTTAANNQQAYIIGPLINSHQGNILQQHQQGGKPGDMQKVLSQQIHSQGLWASPHTFLTSSNPINQLFIRGAQSDQMFIQQQQPLHTNTSTHQHFSMQPITATTQLPATSLANQNSIQNANQQQQQQQQNSQTQQQQQNQLAQQNIQAAQNVLSIKAPNSNLQPTLQPKPPAIQPQPTQQQLHTQQQQQQQQQQHQQQQQQIQQQLVTSLAQHQLQIIPQSTSQPLMTSQPQTITQQLHAQQPRQLILPQQTQQHSLPQVSIVQHTPNQQQTQQTIRPSYTIMTQGTATIPVTQSPLTLTTNNNNSNTSTIQSSQQQQQQAKQKGKKVVNRNSANAQTPTPQQNSNKTVFPRATTISPMPTQVSNGTLTIIYPQAPKPAPLLPQQSSPLTKVQITSSSSQVSSPQQQQQPLKTINMSALHSPPNLPDATLTPLIPNNNSMTSANNPTSNQPIQVLYSSTTSTQLPSPHISITPAPPPSQTQQQSSISNTNNNTTTANNNNTTTSANNNTGNTQKKDESAENMSTENKGETEKENTKSNSLSEESEESLIKQSKLPKAMVKPQVLTHVIEGFVIQEAGEPFPIPKNGESDEPPKKKAALSIQGSGEMGKCEMCGKVDFKAKFKKNKRFCTSVCAKSMKSSNQQQQQVQINSFSPGSNNNSVTNDSAKLKQKSRKWGDGDVDLTDETNSSVGEASSLSPNEDHIEEEPKVNPVKWNVAEVVDFVKSLPGISEYAEEFAVQEIDGQALMLLKEDHLMSAMGMKLGPALKLIRCIQTSISSLDNNKN